MAAEKIKCLSKYCFFHKTGRIYENMRIYFYEIFLWEYIPLNTYFVQKWTAIMFVVGKPQKIKMAPRNLEFFVLNTIERFLFNIV